MLGTDGLSMLVAALVGIGLGAMCYRAWAARAAMGQRRIPDQWELRTRPLFTGVERTVWHWLKRVFFDHHVLVKIPVVRFLLPRSATLGQHSHDLLKGVYCSFTICASDGTVIGCVDIPGSTGLKASHRDLKKKLFDECGMAYAVLSADQLPTLEALRAAFLGDMALAHLPGHEFATSSQMPFSQPADMDPLPPLAVASTPSKAVLQVGDVLSAGAQPGGAAAHPGLSSGINMTEIAAARSSLQSKLDRNRKVRLAKIDELSASMGIVDDNVDQNFAVAWEDSFIMGEESKHPESSKH
jgi:hypothetical protein